MSNKITSLEELRIRKDVLKKEISEKEDLITFDNAKKSLSTFTNGFTDQILKEDINENGDMSISLDKSEILKLVSSEITNSFMTKSGILGLAEGAIKGGLLQNSVKLGMVALVGNFAKNNMKSTSLKKKLIGAALIYIAPVALRMVRKKLEEYQKNKSVSSLEKLI